MHYKYHYILRNSDSFGDKRKIKTFVGNIEINAVSGSFSELLSKYILTARMPPQSPPSITNVYVRDHCYFYAFLRQCLCVSGRVTALQAATRGVVETGIPLGKLKKPFPPHKYKKALFVSRLHRSWSVDKSFETHGHFYKVCVRDLVHFFITHHQ